MLILGLFLLLLVSAISTERINGIIIYRGAALILLYSFILSVYTLDVSTIGSGIGVFGGLYQVTVVSKVMECFIYILAAMVLSNTMLILKNNNSNQNLYNLSLDYNELGLKSEYPIIALFTIVGSILLISSSDLISMYLSIELQSFSLYILATIYRDSQAATSAGLKYFLLGGLSSGFILLGSSIIYAYFGVTNLESIYLLLTTESQNSIYLAKTTFSGLTQFKTMGLLILLTGFLFKIAAAPLHNWSPDVYDGVPTKVTCWLAVIAKISILIFLLDLISIGDPLKSSASALDSLFLEGSLYTNTVYLSPVSNLLLISAFLSLVIGTIVGLAQSRIKRLYAYSTISHLGFLLLAMAINTEDSIESFIFYLIQYSLTSANAFFVLIAFSSLSLTLDGNPKDNLENSSNFSYEEEYSPIQFISQLKGQFKRNNSTSILLSLSLAIILFSMAGIPPLVGFFAKQSVLLAAVKNGFIFLSLIAIIASVISAAYYLRIIKVMLFDPYSNKPENSISNIENTGSNKTSLNSNLFKTLNEKVQVQVQVQVQEDSFSHSNYSNYKSYLLGSYKGEISNSLSFSISLLTVLTIFFVFKPLLILNSAHIMALSLFYI